MGTKEKLSGVYCKDCKFYETDHVMCYTPNEFTGLDEEHFRSVENEFGDCCYYEEKEDDDKS